MSTFDKELEDLINRYSMENDSNTPDYILAKYLMDCLGAFNNAMIWRDKHDDRFTWGANPKGGYKVTTAASPDPKDEAEGSQNANREEIG